VAKIPLRGASLRNAIEAYLEQHSFPRLTLSLILILTGLAGLGISMALLHLGLLAMWIRYPIAVVGAYSFFLLLMRLWVSFEGRRFDPGKLARLSSGRDSIVAISGTRRKGESWPNWLDRLNPFDIPFDEGCLPALLAGIVMALLALLAIALLSAPALFAEVFIDAFLTGILYRRLRSAASEHWLGACLQRTWFFVLLTATLLGLAGFVIELMAPGAVSLGSALQQIANSQK